jgi:hypothetical protein
VLLVPATAVRTQGSSSYVVVMNEDGEFERLTVVVGDSNGTTVEVVSGLSEGDTVYINASAPATDEFTIPVTEATSGANGEQGFGPPGGFQGGNFGGAGGGGAGGAGTAP